MPNSGTVVKITFCSIQLRLHILVFINLTFRIKSSCMLSLQNGIPFSIAQTKYWTTPPPFTTA